MLQEERNIALYLPTPPPPPPIGIPFVLHPRDTWPRGGKYFRGGEKWRPENGATFCDDDYDPGITTHFPLMFHKLFLNISNIPDHLYNYPLQCSV